VKVWLITGASSGLGLALAKEAIKNGDQVIAGARDIDKLSDFKAQSAGNLHPVKLDVRNDEDIENAALLVNDKFKKVDVLVNNAGYGLLGALEELSNEQMIDNFETNFFGAVKMTKAFLPIMRTQKYGHIINISAIAGAVSEMGFTIYGASKAALESLSESLQSEVRHLGIKITIIIPGPFRTEFISKSLVKAHHKIAQYSQTVGKFENMLEKIDGKQAGDPQKAAEAIFLVSEMNSPPMRLFLGSYAYSRIRAKLGKLSDEIANFEKFGLETDFV
jgi:short-subunit dehydrogenase